MSFKLIKKLKSGVRVGELTTPHGKIETPFFMPVGTVGSVKSVSSEELANLGAQIVLANTYHLYLRPGEGLIKQLGGLHNFMNWNKPILTDSGGYQVFSLAKNNLQFSTRLPDGQVYNLQSRSKNQNPKHKSLVKITEDGVEFTSHLDGSKHLFTPEKVIQIQLDLGVDILMPLDVCPSGKASYEEVREACDVTTRWAKRAKVYFDKQTEKLKISNYKYQTNNKIKKINDKCEMINGKDTRPLLHGIVQGGLYSDLRKKHANELIKLDFDGYSIGGLAVDGETRDMWEVVELMCEILPKDKQRYLMGVGTPDDILKATSLGVDMFDCVLPTRLGRHGSVYIKNHKLELDDSHPELVSSFDSTQLDLSKVEQSGSRNKFGMTSEYTLINLLNSKYREDGGAIKPDCNCPACGGGYSRAYISHLLRSNEILGIRLTTLHNLQVYLDLMREIRVNN